MKAIEKIKNHSWAITLILVLFVLLRQCGVNRDIDRMEKSIKSINGKVDSLYVPSTEEIRKEMNKIRIIQRRKVMKNNINNNIIKLKLVDHQYINVRHIILNHILVIIVLLCIDL